MPTNEELYDKADKIKDDGDLEGAIEVLKELLAQDDQYVLAYAALARNYSKLKRHDEAISNALKAVELEPSDPFNYTALSVTYRDAGKIPEAEDAMAKARSIQMGG